MKKVIEELAAKNRISTSYQGSTRTMFLKGENVEQFRETVRTLYPNLAFELKIDSRKKARATLR